MLWHYAMLGHILPPSAKLYFAEDAPFFGINPSKGGKGLVCAKKAVLYVDVSPPPQSHCAQ